MKLVKYYIEIKLNAFDLDYNIKDGYKSFVKFFKTLKIENVKNINKTMILKLCNFNLKKIKQCYEFYVTC